MFGLIVGLSFDLNIFMQGLIGARWLSYPMDFLLTLAWGIAFVCCLIGYNSGVLRGEYLLLCGGGIVIYLITLHRLLKPFFTLLLKPVEKLRRFLSKKLKKRKKSLKKVLHFGK